MPKVFCVFLRYASSVVTEVSSRPADVPRPEFLDLPKGRDLESVKNKQDFTLYGTDYATDDGTCVRDYVHVEDLATAHVMAIDPSIPSDIYNLGTNKGTSNLEVIRAAAKITQQDVGVLHGPKRAGDPAVLTADAGKFMSVSNWRPNFNLEDIIAHAWIWYNR